VPINPPVSITTRSDDSLSGDRDGQKQIPRPIKIRIVGIYDYQTVHSLNAPVSLFQPRTIGRITSRIVKTTGLLAKWLTHHSEPSKWATARDACPFSWKYSPFLHHMAGLRHPPVDRLLILQPMDSALGLVVGLYELADCINMMVSSDLRTRKGSGEAVSSDRHPTHEIWIEPKPKLKGGNNCIVYTHANGTRRGGSIPWRQQENRRCSFRAWAT
jgi:hypothetical protein